MMIIFYFRHSLLAASVIGEINDEFGVQLHVQDLFFNNNVEAMAKLLDQNKTTTNDINLLEELNKLIDNSAM